MCLAIKEEASYNAPAFTQAPNELFTKPPTFSVEQSAGGASSATEMADTSSASAVLAITLGNSGTRLMNPSCMQTALPSSCSTITQLAEATKPLRTPPRSITFSTLKAAQESVSGYLAQWHLEPPERRRAIREQGWHILRGVEQLKKVTKDSYRQQVLGFETQAIDPLVWNRVLQQQQATQSQLNALRSLRTRLLNTCQISIQDQELKRCGIRIATSDTEEEFQLYSSDEDAQQLSDRAARKHAALVLGVGKVLKKHLKEKVLALLDDALDTKMASHITFSTTPELPELFKAYIENLQQGGDEEEGAELLGSLLTEAILQCFSLTKAKKSKLHKIKHELGQAAYQIVLRYSLAQDPSKVESISTCKDIS
ncbi:MAG: hypothetical protein ACX93T_00190 [Bacteroidota bacterium]